MGRCCTRVCQDNLSAKTLQGFVYPRLSTWKFVLIAVVKVLGSTWALTLNRKAVQI